MNGALVKKKNAHRLSARLLILNLFLAQFTFLSLNQAFAVNVTVTAGGNGSISPSGTVVVASGASQVFTLTPNAGYAVQSVTVAGVALTGAALVSAIENKSHTITNVTANQTFAATFATVDPAPTLGPLFIGAGVLYTDIGYSGTLTSKQYSGAAVPDAANRIMYGEIGKTLWLGAMAAATASTSNVGNFSVNLSTNTSLNTAGCSIGSTTQAGTYTSKRIAYASISATGAGSCVVYVSRSTYTNAANGYTSSESLAWTINWGTPCANITTETRNDITCYIGQLGPGGGIVFYDAGNAGYSSFQARYLQAPPSGWYGKDQPANLTPAYSNNVSFQTASNRTASQGDPLFKMCALANTNLTGNINRDGAGDVVLSGTAGSTGPGTSLSYIDQSTRFGSNIGSGPNNDKLYRNSMCAFTPFTPQYELANWKSPSDTQLGRWSVPSYADMIPMVAQSYTLDMSPNGGFYMTSTPCFVDYRTGGNNQTCTNDAGISIMSSPTTFAQVQLQQRISGSFSSGQLLGQVPTWNTAGSMNTSTWIQPGDPRYSIAGFHGINYVTATAFLRPVQSFPYYSTNAKLSTATGLSVIGSVSGTNYTLSPTYNNTVTAYTTSVVTSDSGVKVIPQLDDFRATVTVNGVASTDGQPTTVAVTAGTTLDINVVVTAVSGATQTYKISVTRPLAVQTSTVTVSNSTLQVPTGGVVATTLTATGGNGTGAYSFATSTANCSISGNQLTTTLTSGSCSVTATRLGDSSYAPSSASTAVSFTVTAAGIVPTFDTQVKTATGFTVNVTNYDATYTFNTAASSGSVTKGTAVGSSLPLTVTGLTNGATSTITVTTSKTNFTTQSATVAGAALYSGPSITASALSVAVGTQVSPTISVTGMQLGDEITNVTYTYLGISGTTYAASTTKPTALGNYSVTPSAAVFSPSLASGNYGTPSYVAGNFQITALSRTISFTSPPSTLAYNGTSTLLASPSLGTGTITYLVGSSNGCSISGAVLTITSGSGTCAVTATIASDGTYSSAVTSSHSITITKATRTLTFSSVPTTLSFGNSASAVASVGLGAGGGSVTYSAGASTACSVGSSTGLITVLSGSGSCAISATIAADSNYLSVTTASAASISISPGSQSALTISSSSTKGFANSYTLAATGGTTSGAVTYSVLSSGNTANCSVIGAALTTTGAVGTSCSITATMAGTTNYNSVTSADFVVTIVKSAQLALTISSSTSKPFSTSLPLTTSGGTGNGLVSFEVTSAGTAGCSIIGAAPSFSLVTSGSVGSTCGITATSAQTTTYTAISSPQVTIAVIANAPSAPRITSVSAEDGASTISFTAPSDFGGASSIDEYTVTSSPGGFTCVTSTLTCRVVGLTNGTAYTFSITAKTTSGGTSAASSPSSTVTAVTKASAVTGLRVSTGDAQLILNWLAPTSLGGGTFTSYLIYVKERSAASYGSVAATITDQTILTSTLTGLTNGTPYDVKVVTLTTSDAVEIVGNAAESLQTPAAAPTAPISLNAYSANGTVIFINWQTPLSDGGSPINEYRVSVTSGGNSLTCVLATLTSKSCNISSLTRGATLAISVKAVNGLMGEGSAAIASYLLPNVPGAPTWGTAVASPTTGNAGTIALNWTAPSNNGTRTITSYFVKTINVATSSIIDTQTVFSPIAQISVSDIGISYGYSVYAINEIGDGALSETLTVTTTLPGSVTFGTVTSSSSNVILNVTVGNDGGSPITGFLYSLDGVNYTLINSPSNQLSIPGLIAGTPYRVYVKAKNLIGESAANSISVVLVQSASGGGGGGGGGGSAPSGPSQTEIADAQKAAVDKALADKAAADKVIADKAAADKVITDKAAADKAAADKVIADKAAADKVIADKLAADKSAAAEQFKSTCNLAQGSTAVTSKSSKMKIYSQVCFVPDLMKPVEKDLAQIKSVLTQLKSKKITAITISSFADEKSGVNFKSVAQTRANVVAAMIKKANPKIKITYRLFGSSTKKNSLSLGRVVITA
jgi:hypothetical protein